MGLQPADIYGGKDTLRAGTSTSRLNSAAQDKVTIAVETGMLCRHLLTKTPLKPFSFMQVSRYLSLQHPAGQMSM